MMLLTLNSDPVILMLSLRKYSGGREEKRERREGKTKEGRGGKSQRTGGGCRRFGFKGND
jgi:hypothetical protein